MNSAGPKRGSHAAVSAIPCLMNSSFIVPTYNNEEPVFMNPEKSRYTKKTK
jgi:hypothetical protein